MKTLAIFALFLLTRVSAATETEKGVNDFDMFQNVTALNATLNLISGIITRCAVLTETSRNPYNYRMLSQKCFYTEQTTSRKKTQSLLMVSDLLNRVMSNETVKQNFDQIENTIFDTVHQLIRIMTMFKKSVSTLQRLQASPTQTKLSDIRNEDWAEVENYHSLLVYNESQSTLDLIWTDTTKFVDTSPSMIRKDFNEVVKNVYQGLDDSECALFERVQEKVYYIYLYLVVVELQMFITIGNGHILDLLLYKKDNTDLGKVQQKAEEFKQQYLERQRSVMDRIKNYMDAAESTILAMAPRENECKNIVKIINSPQPSEPVVHQPSKMCVWYKPSKGTLPSNAVRDPQFNQKELYICRTAHESDLSVGYLEPKDKLCSIIHHNAMIKKENYEVLVGCDLQLQRIHRGQAIPSTALARRFFANGQPSYICRVGDSFGDINGDGMCILPYFNEITSEYISFMISNYNIYV